MDVGNLISGSSAFSKTSLSIWKFMVHILLKPGLETFERYFTSMWDECNCAVVWAFFSSNFGFGIGMKTDPFQSCGHCWVFQICWHIECSLQQAIIFVTATSKGNDYRSPWQWSHDNEKVWITGRITKIRHRDTEVNSYFQKNDIDKTCSMQLVTNFQFVKKQKYL